jgi:MSHA pilin protein MshC
MMTPTPFRQRSQSGFTLIELITVMIVLGVMAAVALPRFNQSSFDAAGYRDKVRATLEFARKSAVAQRRFVCVALAGDGLTLTIDSVTPETAGAGVCPLPRLLPLPATDPACGGPVNAICAPPSVTLTAPGPATLTFDALGRPSAATLYTVTDIRTAQTLSVTVTTETGYVF